MGPALASAEPRSVVLDLSAAARRERPRLASAPELRDAAIATWRGRMINEHASAAVFDALAEQLADAGLAPGLVAECRAFAGEERTHGVLCGAVVEALGAEARAIVPAASVLPRHPGVPALEGALRNVLSICCLAETVAVAIIDAERMEMPEGELRELLTRIFSDEIGHARFGWRFLAAVGPSLDAEARARLDAYLAVAFAHLEHHELEHLAPEAAPPGGAALGLCDGRDARALFYATVDQVIVPTLEAHGLSAERAWHGRASRAA
jgi:hypothetical protein